MLTSYLVLWERAAALAGWLTLLELAARERYANRHVPLSHCLAYMFGIARIDIGPQSLAVLSSHS